MISAEVHDERRRISADPAANASSHSCEGTMLSSLRAHATMAASLATGVGVECGVDPASGEEEEESWEGPRVNET